MNEPEVTQHLGYLPWASPSILPSRTLSCMTFPPLGSLALRQATTHGALLPRIRVFLFLGYTAKLTSKIAARTLSTLSVSTLSNPVHTGHSQVWDASPDCMSWNFLSWTYFIEHMVLSYNTVNLNRKFYLKILNLTWWNQECRELLGGNGHVASAPLSRTTQHKGASHESGPALNRARAVHQRTFRLLQFCPSSNKLVPVVETQHYLFIRHGSQRSPGWPVRHVACIYGKTFQPCDFDQILK